MVQLCLLEQQWMQYPGAKPVVPTGITEVDNLIHVMYIVHELLCFAEMYDCDFDQGNTCGWRSYATHFPWAIGGQGTPALGTGPEKDASHSTAGGSTSYHFL